MGRKRVVEESNGASVEAEADVGFDEAPELPFDEEGDEDVEDGEDDC